jgi:hypothetical protein
LSQAFVKDEDPQWLHEIPGTLTALISFLTRENNNIRVYIKNTTTLKNGREEHLMSNGLKYSRDDEGKWMVTG